MDVYKGSHPIIKPCRIKDQVQDSSKLQKDTSIVRFYKIVLSWDYFFLLQESNKNKGKTMDDLGIRRVKDTYEDVDDYISTYEPLLFEEVKAHIINKLEDTKRKLVVDCTEVDGFYLATLTYEKSEMEDKESISSDDLLLLSKQNLQGDTKLPTIYALALVESCGEISIRIRMYLAGEVTNLNIDAVKSCPRLWRMQSLVTSISDADSLSTIIREYVALQSIRSLPFKDIILAASEKNHNMEGQTLKVSRPLEEFVNENLNESQQKAIQAGLSRKPFVLIQGPPGTGKTQTILGLLSAILHASPARVHSRAGLLNMNRGPRFSVQEKLDHWRRASPWLSGSNPRDKTMPVNGDDGFFPTTGNELKPEVVNLSRKYRVRVLVCAPSNSALDEIALRVLNNGVRDENGCSFNPKIVRIGLKVERKKGIMGGGKERDGGADRFRVEILEEAIIVFSTLSFSGSALFSKWNRGFDAVIIDEAAQAVEPAILIPLANGCKQVFLIGDPVQLPATVISPIAAEFGYRRSLFERFQRAGYPVTMLKMQYRMHPEIRSFPSGEFYAGSLVDGPNVEEQTNRSWHEYRCFGPFCLFDLHEGKESELSGGVGWVNVDEVDFVFLLYHKLVSTYPELKSSHQFAIISPYRAQVNLLKERFKSTFGVESDKVVDITTVDGCQGREKNVAIFSCVRASQNRSIGFLTDFRRMNVGITRAKSSILVVGSASTLRKGNEHWNNLVESAEKRGCLLQVSKPYALFFSDENLKSMNIKEESTEAVENDEVNYNAPYNFEDADQAQGDDNGYGEGDMMDMDDGGFGDD